MADFKSSSGKVEYSISGKGEPVVFVHGRTLDSRMWDPQVAELSAKYMCITYDLNGFGKSEIPTSSYSRAQTLLELIQYLSIKNAHFVGLSLGVHVLIDFVLAQPNYVKSLTLVSGAIPGVGFNKEFMDDWNAVETSVKSGNYEYAKELWKNCKAFSSLKQTNPKNYELFELMVTDYTGWDIVNPSKHYDLATNHVARLADISVPALIMTGERDYEDFQNNAQLLHSKISGAKLEVIKGVSHMINLEKPELFNSLLTQFINT